MPARQQLVDGRRWPGVYRYDLQQKVKGRPDSTLMISYRTPDGRMVWEKAGRASEGITPQIASEIRATRLRQARHGDAVLTNKELAARRREEEEARLLHDRPLQEVCDAYFASARGLALKGRATELSRWKLHLSPTLGERRGSSLTPQDVEAIKLRMAGLAPATVHRALEILRRICGWGFRQGLCPPLAFSIAMPTVNNVVTEYLNPDELGRFLAVLADWPTRDVARLLQTALYTGLRRGELFRLEDRDLDFEHGLILLRNPKGGRDCSVPLTPPVAEILRDQIAWRDELFPQSTFIFPGRGGRKRAYCHAARRIKAAAQLPDSFRPFHGLRHNFAVAAINSGEFTLDLVGQLLTHKKAEVTRRYAQFLPQTLQAASARAANIIQAGARRPTEPQTAAAGEVLVEPTPRPRRGRKAKATEPSPTRAGEVLVEPTPRPRRGRKAKGPEAGGDR